MSIMKSIIDVRFDYLKACLLRYQASKLCSVTPNKETCKGLLTMLSCAKKPFLITF